MKTISSHNKLKKEDVNTNTTGYSNLLSQHNPEMTLNVVPVVENN